MKTFLQDALRQVASEIIAVLSAGICFSPLQADTTNPAIPVKKTEKAPLKLYFTP